MSGSDDLRDVRASIDNAESDHSVSGTPGAFTISPPTHPAAIGSQSVTSSAPSAAPGGALTPAVQHSTVMQAIKNFTKHRVLSSIKSDIFERSMVYSILQNEFSAIHKLSTAPSREALWDMCIDNYATPDSKLTYVEFGVYKGYSIKYFASRNQNSDSQFIGLDSFEGLPENWGNMTKGTFDVDGNIPQTNDSRTSFIRGWFQDTWPKLFDRISHDNGSELIVHYDADLYSSTLFALSKIDGLRKSYIAIFDEFCGHEARALHNYSQAFNAKITFLGKTTRDINFPDQLLCRITPTLASYAADPVAATASPRSQAQSLGIG